MNTKELIRRARELAHQDSIQMAKPSFQKTVAWLHYLGLLRHNKIAAKRHNVTLAEALDAAALEPRIFELLPAIILILPDALKHTPKKIPDDLKVVLKCIRERRDAPIYHGISPQKYMHWLNAPAMQVAQRRLDFRHMPRRVKHGTKNTIADVIKQGRSALSLTQKQLAEQYGISLRALRDLEQGKLAASVATVNEILKIFGRKLQV